MDTALPQKYPFILDRNLAKANCTGNRVCTSCDTVVLGLSHSHLAVSKSAALLLGVTMSTLCWQCWPSTCRQISTRVSVLPVPGGPWMRKGSRNFPRAKGWGDELGAGTKARASTAPTQRRCSTFRSLLLHFTAISKHSQKNSQKYYDTRGETS